MELRLDKGSWEASQIVFARLASILESKLAAVIIGGHVPSLLIPDASSPHRATHDIDLVLDLHGPQLDDTTTLHDALLQNLFQQDPKRPFRYYYNVEVEGAWHEVVVEFLAGGSLPRGGMRLIRTEEVHVTIIPGVELALTNNVRVMIPGSEGQSILVASLPAFLAMKAKALQTRALGLTDSESEFRRSSETTTSPATKERTLAVNEANKRYKDAYDIIYCLKHYKGGVKGAALDCRPALDEPLFLAGLRLLAVQFESPSSDGSVSYAKSLAGSANHERINAREAHELVKGLLAELQILNE